MRKYVIILALLLLCTISISGGKRYTQLAVTITPIDKLNRSLERLENEILNPNNSTNNSDVLRDVQAVE